MEKNSLEQTIALMRAYIERDVAAGFASVDEICNSAVDIFSDEQDASILLPYAQQITLESITLHSREQVEWEDVTDCDHLDKAFEELESKGIVSRQNFSCCGNCGTGEILDEAETLQNKGRNIRGYTFYHMQDTQHAVDGQGLYLNYGSIEGDEETSINIGREIVDIINQHNLSTGWNGDWGMRIFVKLDWTRRR